MRGPDGAGRHRRAVHVERRQARRDRGSRALASPTSTAATAHTEGRAEESSPPAVPAHSRWRCSGRNRTHLNRYHLRTRCGSRCCGRHSRDGCRRRHSHHGRRRRHSRHRKGSRPVRHGRRWRADTRPARHRYRGGDEGRGGRERPALHDICPPWTLMGGKGGRGRERAAGVAGHGWPAGVRPLPTVAEGLAGGAPPLPVVVVTVTAVACPRGSLSAAEGQARRGVRPPVAPLLSLPPMA